MSHDVLFVCTGNICRSPMAEALFAAKAKRMGDSFTVHSAGTWALEGSPASSNAMVVMANRGLDLNAHRGTMIDRALMDQADAIIVMTRNHREALVAEFPHHRAKIHLMSELRNQTFDIGDPYGGVLAEYESCARQLERLVEDGYDRIKTWTNSNS
jgi:protein arginine phosphatase